MTSKTPAIFAAIIALTQAVIALVNAFGWVSISGEQAAAITAVITGVAGVWATRKVNDQVGVALYTTPPAEAAQKPSGPSI